MNPGQKVFEFEVDSLKLDWLESRDYEAGVVYQKKIADGVRSGSAGRVIACEHEPSITLGKRSQALTDILVSLETLRERKIKIVATERGGHATFHNLGQLVIYPILPLRRWNLGVRLYVECLERASAFLFADYGIEVTRGYEPGLWVNEKKIAAFGIRVDRGISLHGAALNIYNDLSNFELIKQCGMRVLPTNLKLEMEEFTIAPQTFDLRLMAQKWLEYFKEQIKVIEPRVFELDVPTPNPLQNL